MTVDQKLTWVIARAIFLNAVALRHHVTGSARTCHVLSGDVPWASCDIAGAVHRLYFVPHAMLRLNNTTESAFLELRHWFCQGTHHSTSELEAPIQLVYAAIRGLRVGGAKPSKPCLLSTMYMCGLLGGYTTVNYLCFASLKHTMVA